MFRCLTMLILAWLSASGWAANLKADDPAWRGGISLTSALSGTSTPASGTIAERGQLASDSLRGNGTRAGYVLAHGSIIPGSESVTVDGSSKRRNVDYYLDASNGTLMFSEPVKNYQSIRVTYHYSAAKDGERSASPASSIALRFGQNASVGLTYGYSASAANGGADMTTYGLNLTNKVGQRGSMSNLVYVSTPQDSKRTSLNFQGGAQDTSQETAKQDRLFLHNSDLSLGQLNVKMNFQDVGRDFAGFATMRQQKSTPDVQIKQLEKEKGLQRMGMQAGYKLGLKSSTDLSWSRITEGGSDILRQSLGFTANQFKLNMNVQDIGRDFTRFADLAEAERGQWEKERGIRRTDFQLGFAGSSGANSANAWNMFRMGEISDISGKISRSSFNYTGDGLSFFMSENKVDSGFARLYDIKQEDRAQMALAIRRQFDPNAQSKSVTGADLAHILAETGIGRRNYGTSMRMGKINTSLQMVNINSAGGDIDRNSISLQGKDYRVSAFTQNIDRGFTNMTGLAPLEKLNFGNEYGMRRTNMTGEVRLNPELRLATSFANVTDNTAELQKYGLSLTGSKYNIGLRFQNIAPNFTRILDLADSDRTAMEAEQGMRRWDISTHFVASKSVIVDNYFYNARHSAEDLFKRQLKNSVMINMKNGPRISLLMDGVNSGSTDQTTNFMRRVVALNHTMGSLSMNASQDLAVTEDWMGNENKVESKVLRMAADVSSKMSLVGDWKNIDNSNGTFEDTKTLRMSARVSPAMTLTSMRSVTMTEQAETVSQEYGISGKASDNLNIGFKVGNTVQNGQVIGNLREISLTPGRAQDCGMFKQLKWSLRWAEVESQGNITSQNRAVGVNTLVLNHRISAEYGTSITKDGQQPTNCRFSVKSNDNPQDRMHYNLSYKALDLPGIKDTFIIRRFSADWRIDDNTRLDYNYSSLNERSITTIDPVGTERYKLTSIINKSLSANTQWESVYDNTKDESKTTLSFGLTGKLSQTQTLEASYGFENVLTSAGSGLAHTFRMKYDVQMSPDRYLSLSGKYINWSGEKPTGYNGDDAVFHLDFKALFN